jgi:hypothetical protein
MLKSLTLNIKTLGFQVLEGVQPLKSAKHVLEKDVKNIASK